jgi:hypothetical protein
MDERAAGLQPRPTVYLVGAGALVLTGVTGRATLDLDFICDGPGERFVNVITAGGILSRRVPAGLVAMPPGWRDRALPLAGVDFPNLVVLVPELADRLLDKVARGTAPDWDDLAAIVGSAECPEATAIRSRALALLASPSSSVFEEPAFRRNYKRLQGLLRASGRSLGDLPWRADQT